ncbi:BMP family ABC transporter substrate-binding protein [Fictibacillus iocasae]|uniref:BMP family ABC transporter substrate-binding protein n=1 Tax=Fictibacillus iocasae TaxID=2715437 RepID=A0ABW2NMB3_9BACL
MRGFIAVLCTALLLLTGCSSHYTDGKLKNAGILIEDTIADQGWGTKGYKGLLAIQEEFENDVYYEENIKSREQAIKAVEEFKKNGVNLIFGHGKVFAEYFQALSKDYPAIHFVSFNGSAEGKNETSLTFSSYAMGFFAGMVAAEVSKTHQAAVIGAMKWQPELQGFKDGANYANDETMVHTNFVNSWSDKEKALIMFDEMLEKNADVFYPAGDGFAIPIIEKAKEKERFAIGYVSDHSDIGKAAVLTSTVQHVDKLYLLAAKRFNDGKLKSGNLSFDFKDEVVALGKFSPVVNKKFEKKMRSHIDKYKKTGKLPNGEQPK